MMDAKTTTQQLALFTAEPDVDNEARRLQLIREKRELLVRVREINRLLDTMMWGEYWPQVNSAQSPGGAAESGG